MNSRHSDARAKQRGIYPLVIQCLRNFGERVYDHQGAVIYHFNKCGWRKLESKWGREAVRRLFADYRDAYIVVSAADNSVITVGKRYKRIKH